MAIDQKWLGQTEVELASNAWTEIKKKGQRPIGTLQVYNIPNHIKWTKCSSAQKEKREKEKISLKIYKIGSNYILNGLNNDWNSLKRNLNYSLNSWNSPKWFGITLSINKIHKN